MGGSTAYVYLLWHQMPHCCLHTLLFVQCHLVLKPDILHCNSTSNGVTALLSQAAALGVRNTFLPFKLYLMVLLFCSPCSRSQYHEHMGNLGMMCSVGASSTHTANLVCYAVLVAILTSRLLCCCVALAVLEALCESDDAAN